MNIDDEKKIDAEKCLQAAETAFAAGKLDKAERMLLKAERLYPTSRAKQMLNVIKVTRGFDINSEAVSNRSTFASGSSESYYRSEDDEKGAERCVEIALKAIENGNLDRAKRFLLKSIRIFPNEMAKEMLNNIGTENFSSTTYRAKQVVRDEEESNKCIGRAEAEIVKGRLGKAERLLKKAERLCPSIRAKNLLRHVEAAKRPEWNEEQERKESRQSRQQQNQDRQQEKPKRNEPTPEQLAAFERAKGRRNYYESLATPIPTSVSSAHTTALFGAAPVPSVVKSPINRLYETYPGLTFTCTFGDGSLLDSQKVAPNNLSPSMRFKVVYKIKDQKFEGYGSNKKLAKLAAARSALAVLEEGGSEPRALQYDSPPFLPMTLADHIGKLVNKKFHEVMKSDAVHSKRQVLAGIVITIDNKTENAKVIAVTTGTKCVSGEHMSVRGRAVNDCHAEVVARRCLQRHLYAQLLRYAHSADPTRTIPDSDLEPIPGGGYQMKPNRQIHLYVSTAPCGDGRIFSPHEHLEPDKHPNRLARGQLRTKIESGEGSIPVKNCLNVVQTWDGVLQGERLLTMSCSDKVARWCVVGMQGALLSRYIRPVYLHSLVLGSLLHPHHMYRALCGRIEAYISCLPPPFRLARPLLARAASTEARTPARAPSFSVCWANTTPLPEVINPTTGKLENGQPSLLCKQSMFARWQYLSTRIPHLAQDRNLSRDQAPLKMKSLLYNEAKQLCPAYQVAKQRLVDAFEKANLGSWIKKPIEQDQFICEITGADPSALFA